MKVYMHYEDSEDGKEEKALTLKLTLPKKWLSQPLLQVLELFIESYNEKKADVPPLDVAGVHVEKTGGVVLQTSNIVEEVVSDRDDLYVKLGALAPVSKGSTAPLVPSSSPSTSPMEANGKGKLRCKNYGCNQFFEESNNGEAACKFHTAPPVFHDTKKGWACCAKRVYDWDEFHTIEGCATGRHSTVDPKEVFAPSPTVAAVAEASGKGGGAAPVTVKSIEEYNRANPEAATASKAAAASVKQAPSRCTLKPDGTATCLNKGCQKVYQVKDNHPLACSYHQTGPVFHDAGKFWSCCPGTVKYDFDDFLKIPGCMQSSHLDGSPESLRDFETNARKRDS